MNSGFVGFLRIRRLAKGRSFRRRLLALRSRLRQLPRPKETLDSSKLAVIPAKAVVRHPGGSQQRSWSSRDPALLESAGELDSGLRRGDEQEGGELDSGLRRNDEQEGGRL